MIEKYFTAGSMSEPEGLTLHTAFVDETTGKPILQYTHMYKEKEVSRDEYIRLLNMLKDPSVPKGLAGGIVNEKGLEKARKMWNEIEEGNKREMLEKAEPRIALAVKKIKKQLELGIISSEDIDSEIGLNNMTEFKDEIKKRLEQ